MFPSPPPPPPPPHLPQRTSSANSSASSSAMAAATTASLAGGATPETGEIGPTPAPAGVGAGFASASISADGSRTLARGVRRATRGTRRMLATAPRQRVCDSAARSTMRWGVALAAAAVVMADPTVLNFQVRIGRRHAAPQAVARGGCAPCPLHTVPAATPWRRLSRFGRTAYTRTWRRARRWTCGRSCSAAASWTSS
jgi:hypothetical protein